MVYVHRTLYLLKVETIRNLSGSQTRHLPVFKQKLAIALSLLQKTGSARADITPQDLRDLPGTTSGIDR